MDCNHRIEVPLRSGKKMKKRRELDALIAHSIRNTPRNAHHSGAQSQDKLLSVSTDDPEDYVWTNVSGTSRRAQRKNIYFRMCAPLIITVASVLFVAILYWLYFDLRQQILDNRQKLEEVSAISKNFPDTLQKWHETSSFLLKNQTSVINRLNDLQQTVEGLRTNLSLVNSQRNFGEEEKLVADFGAKLEAVATDIEAIKEHYNRYTEVQKGMQSEMDSYKANLTQLSAQQPITTPQNISQDLKVLNQTITLSLQELQNKLKDSNNTMSQEAKILHDEIQIHKTKLDDLFDRSENVTSHVTTLRNSWQKLNKIEQEVAQVKTTNNNLAVAVGHLESVCKVDNINTLTNPKDNANLTTVQPILSQTGDEKVAKTS